MPHQAKPLASLQTALPPDSIALLPAKQGVQHAVIGSYSLEESTSRRSGALNLLGATYDNQHDDFQLTIDHVYEELPGVLDVQFVQDANLLFAACAEDSLFAFDVNLNSTFQKKFKLDYDDCDKERLVLSLHVTQQQNDIQVASCDSKGGVTLHTLSSNKSCVKYRDSSAHTDQVWSISSDPKRSVLYSGGDDGQLRAYAYDQGSRVFAKRKAHAGVGVTCVEQREEYELWSGGFDDCVRVWDLRNVKECMREVNVGGGVWRIRFGEEVLVAAMYGGVRILDGDVVGEFGLHESMVYGGEWMGWEGVGISCSFYDRWVRVWKWGREGRER